MSKLTYVADEYGEWTGIYIDGKLDYENHSIPVWVWLDVINLGNLKEAEQFYVNGSWMEEVGSLPVSLEDIPQDNIYK